MQYQGGAFAIIGFYFAHNGSNLKKRTLVYVLRPFNGEGSAGLLLAE
ncbi:MAG: hypothetical protein ACRDFW_05265 [bacterium]